MRKFRKFVRYFVAALITFVTGMSLFAAPPGPGGYPAYTGKPAELTMWAWTSNENYSIDLFQKAYPNIKIKWDNVGDGSTEYQKVLTATAAGSGLPDIIMSEYAFAPQFMAYGTFQEINKWVPKDTYLKYFPEVTLKWTSMDGKIYGTPQDSGAMTMVYRKDVYDKYGLTVPKTWAEFQTQAAKLHAANPNITMMSYSANGWFMPYGLVWQAGGKLFDYADGKWYVWFTNPTALKVYDYWSKMIKDKLVRPDAWWNADWYKELTDGVAANVVCGGWFPEWLQLNTKASSGNWRVALVPQWDASNPQNGEIGGSGFFVSSQCKNPEAAALFVLWLNSAEESLVQLHDKSQLPILWAKNFTDKLGPKLAEQEYPFFGGQKITQSSLESMKQVKTAFTSIPIFDYFSSSHDAEFKKFLDGKEDIRAFLENWQGSVVSFMKKQGFNNMVVGRLPQSGPD